MSFKWDDLKAEMDRQAAEEKAHLEKKHSDLETENSVGGDSKPLPEWQTDKILTGETSLPNELREAMKRESPSAYDVVFMRYLKRRRSVSAVQDALQKEWELRYEELGELIHGLHDHAEDMKGLPRIKDMDMDKMDEMQENAIQGAERLHRIVEFTEGFKMRVLLPARSHVGRRTWKRIVKQGPLSKSAFQGYKCLWWCQRSITRMDSFAKPAKFARFLARRAGVFK